MRASNLVNDPPRAHKHLGALTFRLDKRDCYFANRCRKSRSCGGLAAASRSSTCVGSTSRSRTVLSRVPRFLASDFELERSARSVVQFEGELPEAASCVAYAPVDLDGQFGIIVVDVPPEVYELIRLVVDMAIFSGISLCVNT